jgi:hypothetical protein
LFHDISSRGFSVSPRRTSSGARIAVIATELPPHLMPEDEFPKALDKGKSQPVNLVFVMQRKGVAFRRFFRCLFEDMFDGETMAMAWVKLAPGCCTGRPICRIQSP